MDDFSEKIEALQSMFNTREHIVLKAKWLAR
jgi:hypothetical protein